MRQNLFPRPPFLHIASFALALALAPSTLVLAQDSAKNTARGVLRSASEATLSTDMSQRVLQIPFKSGQAFKKGELLIAFDCERAEGEMKMAEAESRGAKATYDNSTQLYAQKAAGALEVALAKAQWDKSVAALAIATTRTKPCQQSAPFSGRVVEVLVHEHDTPPVNSPLIRIVDTDNIEVDLLVPSLWLRWLKADQDFRFRIDETGQEVSGAVIRMGAVVDPVSQTVKITGRLLPDAVRAGSVLPGMSGTAVFAGGG